MRETFFVFLLASIVAVSGCTSGGSADESARKDVPANFVHVLDVQGGTPLDEAEESVRNRMNVYGVTYVSIRSAETDNSSSVMVYTPDNSVEKVKEVLKPVDLHASLNLYLTEDSELELEQEHPVSFSEDSLNVSGTVIQAGETGEVENVTLTYNGVAEDQYANVTAEIFDSSEIIAVRGEETRIMGGAGSYSYSFPVVIEEEAARRMKLVTGNLKAPEEDGMLQNSLGDYAMFDVFFRGEKLSSLRISPAFQEQVISEPSIRGAAETQSEAENQAEELVNSIRVGKLPSDIELESVNRVNSTE